MYKIIVKGEAQTSYPNLEELDGIDCQDNFSEYFDRNFSFKNDVNGGYMRFEFKKDKLWTITEYNSNRKLTEDELNSLKNYTTGQWSDGIGEGFEQEPCKYVEPYEDEEGEETEEVFISPWNYGQITTIEQIEQ